MWIRKLSITNDGEWAHNLLFPKNMWDKGIWWPVCPARPADAKDGLGKDCPSSEGIKTLLPCWNMRGMVAL